VVQITIPYEKITSQTAVAEKTALSLGRVGGVQHPMIKGQDAAGSFKNEAEAGVENVLKRPPI
jgi:hypothetical protein